MAKQFHRIILFSLGIIFSFNLHSQSFNEQAFKFTRVLSLINTFYVDTVNQESLVEEAITAMLKDLDPHSVYIPEKELKEMNEPLEGAFEGIGIQFNILNDTLYVVSPISGGPSEKLGILAGDRIVKIDSENVAGVGLKNSDVLKKLRGKKGTKVTVYILRRNVKELLEFEITRDKIPIYSLDASYMVDDKTGYIKLNRFSATTINEFEKAMDKLQKQGMQNLILDLTYNGGGLLKAAIELADEFLKSGKMIVFTEGINSRRQENHSTDYGKFENGKLVVMIDEGSASASEIVSGAIQDWDRGLIVGRRSFGKGLVQRPFRLPDGSAIRLTIARYYTPTGRLIQKPYDHGSKAYRNDLINRYNNGELMHEDSIHFPDSLKFNTLNSKRVVYGGGGIMPDYFIPMDTSYNSAYYRDLIRKGIFNRFALNYVDENRKHLEKKYPDFKTFKEKFPVDDAMMEKLYSFAEEQKLKRNEKDIEISSDNMSIQLKALIARTLWNSNEYFEIINQLDPIFKKAYEAIESDEEYYSKLGVNNSKVKK
ncbi:MAG: S41 family peptidase [Chlorobi bacterium]|nr:S41 family peptidase [Chlorobiota bacterium]